MRKNFDKNWSSEGEVAIIAPFRRRRRISSSHAFAPIGDNLGSCNEIRGCGREEKGILYPLIASNTSGSRVIFFH